MINKPESDTRNLESVKSNLAVMGRVCESVKSDLAVTGRLRGR